MSGEDRAREVLAEARRTLHMLDPDGQILTAMRSFGEQCREEGRLAALDATVGVARGWPHHPVAIEIVRRIEALKDQKS